MVQIERDDKGLIDLDDTSFDVALEHYPQTVDKNREDMREVRIDGESADETEEQHEVNEGDGVTPANIVSELQFGSGSILSTNTTTDDEDLTSGSGSGDFMIEDATGLYVNTTGKFLGFLIGVGFFFTLLL